jgi:hypothetical protein
MILFTPSPNAPISRVPAAGGGVVAVTKQGQLPGQAGWPQFLPGDRQFLFYVLASGDAQGIYTGSLDSTETKRLTAADSGGQYLPSGWMLYTRQGTLVARRFDPARIELTGDPVHVADVVGGFSVSAAGLVAYRSAGAAGRRQLTWFDRGGKPTGTLGVPMENTVNGLIGPEISPDGRRAAVTRAIQGQDNNMDIWLLDGTRTSRFTFSDGQDSWPVWSPDGTRIIFLSNRNQVNQLYQKPSNGSSPEERVTEGQQVPTDWSPDGRFILYFTPDPKTSFDLWVLPLEGNQKPFPFVNTNFGQRKGQFSPDGRWVAYQSDESGQEDVYVRPFPGPGGQWQISTAGGIWPRWSRDGKEIYYIATNAKLMAVPVTSSGKTFQPGTPIALFQTRIVGGGSDPANSPHYDVAPDGGFLINTILDDTASPITLIQNWTPPAN